MPSETSINERLASLEAKLEFLKELLQEIRSDVKNQPSREEFDNLERRVASLEKTQTSLSIKIGIASGIMTLVLTMLVEWFKK